MILSLILLVCQVATPVPDPVPNGDVVTHEVMAAGPLDVLTGWKSALDERLTRTEQASDRQYHTLQSIGSKILERIETFGERIESFANETQMLRGRIQATEERVGPIVRLLRFIERYSILVVVGFALYVLMQLITFFKAIVDILSPWIKKKAD